MDAEITGARARTSGTFYFGNGPTNTVQTNVANTIVIQDLGGNLYFSTQKITNGIWKISGTPTAPAAASLLLKTGGSSATYAFAFNPGFTTAYLADDTLKGNGGIQRWDFNGSGMDHELRLLRHHQRRRTRTCGGFQRRAAGHLRDHGGKQRQPAGLHHRHRRGIRPSPRSPPRESTSFSAAWPSTPDNGAVPQFFSSARNGNNFTLSWTALVNRNYTLQYTGDLGSTNWITLTNLTAALPVLTVTDPGPPVNTNRFYRLSLNP